MRILAIGPWKVIKATSVVLNKWQRLVSPISYAIFLSGDAMDRQTPTVRAILVWFWNTISLGLHFVDVSRGLRNHGAARPRCKRAWLPYAACMHARMALPHSTYTTHLHVMAGGIVRCGSSGSKWQGPQMLAYNHVTQSTCDLLQPEPQGLPA